MVAVLALTLGGCGDVDESPASSASESTPSSRSSSSSAEALDRPEQQQLDADSIADALPTLKDMPDGWAVNASPVSAETSTYAPAACADIEFSSPEALTFEDEHLEATQRVAYSEYTSGPMEHLSATLSTYDRPYPVSLFDRAGEHVTDCASYTRGRGGEDESREAEAITAPILADRSVAVRFVNPALADDRVDVLTVRAGHNRVQVTLVTHDGTYDDQRLSGYAQDILDKLKKTS